MATATSSLSLVHTHGVFGTCQPCSSSLSFLPSSLSDNSQTKMDASALVPVFRRLRSLGVNDVHDAKKVIRTRYRIDHLMPSHIQTFWIRSGQQLQQPDDEGEDEKTSNKKGLPIEKPDPSPIVMELWELKRRQYCELDLDFLFYVVTTRMASCKQRKDPSPPEEHDEDVEMSEPARRREDGLAILPSLGGFS